MFILETSEFTVYKLHVNKAVYTVLNNITVIMTYMHMHKNTYTLCYTCTHIHTYKSSL